MSRRLIVVAVTGLGVCAICLAGAAAIGGRALGETGFDLGSVFSGRPVCDVVADGKTATRTLDWDGSDHAGVSVPANVHYHAGQGDKLIVSGDAGLVSHVLLHDGDVQSDCRARGDHDRIEVTLPGRQFKRFSIAGTGSLALDAIAQSDLKIRLAGSANVTANGKVDDLDLSIAGSGEGKLGSLAADDVKLKIAGSGDVEVAPKDRIDADIAGSGKVTLMTEPRTVQTHIAGSGQIIHAAAL